MWRLLVFLAFFLTFIYYVTLFLHLLGIIQIGNKSGFRAKYLIPFCLWLE